MRLHEVVLEVGDVAQAVAFYLRLGLELRKQGAWEGGAYAELADPEGLKILLTEGDGPPRLSFTVEDAAAALDVAVSAGARMQDPAQAGGQGLWATAMDPWGNPIGFWSRR